MSKSNTSFGAIRDGPSSTTIKKGNTAFGRSFAGQGNRLGLARNADADLLAAVARNTTVLV